MSEISANTQRNRKKMQNRTQKEQDHAASNTQFSHQKRKRRTQTRKDQLVAHVLLLQEVVDIVVAVLFFGELVGNRQALQRQLVIGRLDVANADAERLRREHDAVCKRQ